MHSSALRGFACSPLNGAAPFCTSGGWTLLGIPGRGSLFYLRRSHRANSFALVSRYSNRMFLLLLVPMPLLLWLQPLLLIILIISLLFVAASKELFSLCELLADSDWAQIYTRSKDDGQYARLPSWLVVLRRSPEPVSTTWTPVYGSSEIRWIGGIRPRGKKTIR